MVVVVFVGVIVVVVVVVVFCVCIRSPTTNAENDATLRIIDQMPNGQDEQHKINTRIVAIICRPSTANRLNAILSKCAHGLN